MNISESVIYTKGSESIGMSFSQIGNSSVTNTNISANKKEEVSILSSISYPRDYFFTNVSYNEEVVTYGKLIRKWYYRAVVNDSAGNNVLGANITAYNVSNSYQFNLTTDSSGYTSITTITDYINNGGTKFYYSLYTIYANNITLSDSHEYNVTLEQNNLKDVFTLIPVALPNDTNKFYIKNASGDNVAWLGDFGNIVLKGKCYSGGNCDNPGEDSFIVGNLTDDYTSFINSTGDLCIEKGTCAGSQSSACNPTRDAFIVRNASDSNMLYIDIDGGLCLTGSLYEESEP